MHGESVALWRYRPTSHKKIMTVASDSWIYRRQGEEMMAKANNQVLWLLRRLDSITSKKETDGLGGRRSHDAAAVIRDGFSLTLGNRVSETTINAANISAIRKDTQLTIFDLNHLAEIYRKSALENDCSLSLLLKSLEMDELVCFGDVENANGDDQNGEEEEMRICWNAMMNDPRTKQLNLVRNISSPPVSPSSWEDVLLLPHRTAAARILLSSCSDTNGHNNMAISKCATSADVDVSEKSIHEYLLRHASQTHGQIEHFKLPSLQKQLLLHEEHYHQQERRLKQISQMYDTAFEKWDDFCTDVLGVESDSLPLFPTMSMDEDESELQCNISEYTKEVGMHVVDSMRDEFDKLSIRFFHSLTKCYGEDIINAIHHYRQFTSFISIAASSSGGDDVDNNTAEEDEENDGTNLATLYRFVVSSSNHNEKDDPTSDRELIMQFKKSPSTRARLISDLQQLEAFLSSRKRELSSHRSLSSARGGRDVIDAMELEWTQCCMAQSPPLSQSPASLEDVTRYHSSARNIISQILGNGSATTRMSFLADNVGVPTIDHDTYSDSFATPLRATCRNAALLAHRMALYQCAQEASTKIVEACALAVGSTREEISTMERRIIRIRDGLDQSVRDAMKGAK